MKVYFVRHGESETNASEIYFGETASLTPHGLRQADLVAERFQSIDIDIILSSTLVRAKETAAVINQPIKKEIIFSDLLVERKFPSEMIGKLKEGPEAKRYYETARANVNDPGWRFSDAENFWDLYNRAKATWQLIEARPEENILVVTHGVFLRFIIWTMLVGKKFTPEIYYNSPGWLKTGNTGITICEKVPDDPRWRLITWNDYAHLGDPEK
jgi:2,3-bisphosphoglycerate-dependent phosphoglycerate mutase